MIEVGWDEDRVPILAQRAHRTPCFERIVGHDGSAATVPRPSPFDVLNVVSSLITTGSRTMATDMRSSSRDVCDPDADGAPRAATQSASHSDRAAVPRWFHHIESMTASAAAAH